MRKEDLRNGQIVIARDGYAGVVILADDGEGYILYQETGGDELWMFNDDLTYSDDRDGDIMEVYGNGCFICTFLDIEEEMPVWKRDAQWRRPTPEERRAKEEKMEKMRQREIEEMRKVQSEARKNFISVISQQFYGNRTGAEIDRDKVPCFLRGILAEYKEKDITDVDLKMVRMPGSDHLVILYDQTQEDKYVNIEFPEDYKKYGREYLEETGRELAMHVSCDIPETGFKIHTRCFACRIDENGVLQSLEEGDSEKIIKVFPMR